MAAIIEIKSITKSRFPYLHLAMPMTISSPPSANPVRNSTRVLWVMSTALRPFTVLWDSELITNQA